VTLTPTLFHPGDAADDERGEEGNEGDCCEEAHKRCEARRLHLVLVEGLVAQERNQEEQDQDRRGRSAFQADAQQKGDLVSPRAYAPR
jgi:hypothetical protein